MKKLSRKKLKALYKEEKKARAMYRRMGLDANADTPAFLKCLRQDGRKRLELPFAWLAFKILV
jgi:hypothetical protein